jgi:hypothetical protein
LIFAEIALARFFTSKYYRLTICSTGVIVAEIVWIAHFFQAFWIISLCLMLIEQPDRSAICAKTRYYQSRPRRCRQVASVPQSDYYKPRGIPLQHITLTVDELEAIGTAGEDIAEDEVGRGGFRVEQTQVGSLKNTNRCYNWV